MNKMGSTMGDLIYTVRNLVDALNDRHDLFEKDEELLDLLEEAQRSLDKFSCLDEEELE